MHTMSMLHAAASLLSIAAVLLATQRLKHYLLTLI